MKSLIDEAVAEGANPNATNSSLAAALSKLAAAVDAFNLIQPNGPADSVQAPLLIEDAQAALNEVPTGGFFGFYPQPIYNAFVTLFNQVKVSWLEGTLSAQELEQLQKETTVLRASKDYNTVTRQLINIKFLIGDSGTGAGLPTSIGTAPGDLPEASYHEIMTEVAAIEALNTDPTAVTPDPMLVATLQTQFRSKRIAWEFFLINAGISDAKRYMTEDKFNTPEDKAALDQALKAAEATVQKTIDQPSGVLQGEVDAAFQDLLLALREHTDKNKVSTLSYEADFSNPESLIYVEETDSFIANPEEVVSVE